MEDQRLDIVKLLLAHGVPAPELVPTARDVLAFVTEGACCKATPFPVVDNKKPEPLTDAEISFLVAGAATAPVRWTEERLFELERWCASGASHIEIARHFGKTAKGIEHAARKAGIPIRWPRRGGKPLFTPVPLDAPWPSSAGVTPAQTTSEIPARPHKPRDTSEVQAGVRSDEEPTAVDGEVGGSPSVPDVDESPEPSKEEPAAIEETKAEPVAFVRWTPERVFELERWCASGARHNEIAVHFGTSAGAIRFAIRKFGIDARWPRQKGPGGKLLFVPVPLDVPWPGDQAETGDEAEPEADAPETGIVPIPNTVPAREVLPARRARRVRHVTATPPTPTPAQAFILDWLRERGTRVGLEGGGWRWEKDTGLTFRQILGRANNLRLRDGLSPFADPEPDPLATPIGADGRSICGSSLASVE